jgi:hypothetical protein
MGDMCSGHVHDHRGFVIGIISDTDPDQSGHGIYDVKFDVRNAERVRKLATLASAGCGWISRLT